MKQSRGSHLMALRGKVMFHTVGLYLIPWPKTGEGEELPVLPGKNGQIRGQNTREGHRVAPKTLAARWVCQSLAA